MLTLQAHAKINWDLHVLGKRPDSFHALDTVMVNVSLCDTLTFERSAGLEFTCSDPALPTGEHNLVVKAAQALARAAGQPAAARIHLEKRIPAGGGMGGGSSDGASTLRGLNRLWGLNWPVPQLQPLAAELGSDVAFFLFGGWRRCLGRGEIVEQLPGSEQWPEVKLLLIMPPLHVSTPAVYKALQAPQWSVAQSSGLRRKPEACATSDRTSGVRKLEHVAAGVAAALGRLGSGASAQLGTRNDLVGPARLVEPQLAAVQRLLEECYPGRWQMSGSGAVHFAVAQPDVAQAVSLCSQADSLRHALTNACGPGIRVVAATTCGLDNGQLAMDN
ncbi:MAG: 4-(cytidine 5'-diphospho)-2-C-methyl-D-erythritol kinase [Planctomycetota bacterium]